MMGLFSMETKVDLPFWFRAKSRKVTIHSKKINILILQIQESLSKPLCTYNWYDQIPVLKPNFIFISPVKWNFTSRISLNVTETSKENLKYSKTNLVRVGIEQPLPNQTWNTRKFSRFSKEDPRNSWLLSSTSSKGALLRNASLQLISFSSSGVKSWMSQ